MRAFVIGIVLAIIPVLWGLCLLPLGVNPPLLIALLYFALGGLVWGPYTILETSLIQRTVPANLHGRTFGARSALLAPSVSLGAVLGGLLLEATSSSTVIVISGLACVFAGLLGFALPALRKVGYAA
jgi:predicted MFS family arabinose efflux permease